MIQKSLRGIDLLKPKGLISKKSKVPWSETKSRYACTALLQPVLEKHFLPLKGCGRIIVKMEAGDGSKLCFFPVIRSQRCDICERKINRA